jgi:hypothetical protein
VRSKSVTETAIMCGSAVVALALIVGALVVTKPQNPLVVVFGLIALGMVMWSAYFTVTRRASIEVAGGDEYRRLADEYRRLADMAITAQEHTDLRLTELSVRIDELGKQMERLQHILKEVE